MLKRLVVLGLIVGVGLGLAWGGFAQSSDKAKGASKIDGALLQVAQSAASQSSSIQTARALGVPFDGSTITVTVVLNNPSPRSNAAAGLSNALSRVFGGTSVVASQSKTFVRLRLGINQVAQLEQLVNANPNIAYIRPPLDPETLATSEGVSAIGAQALHDQGVLGQNTKVAVIDLGFAGLSSARSRGELPGSAVTRDFTGSGLEFGTSHGTAVAEILHDVAPNAQLYLYKIGDEVDLENAVDEAIAQGIDIINHSVGWFNTSYYDGTGVIADIVNRATSNGILWINSAGNYAQKHFRGMFRDGNGNGWMEFAGGDESLDIQANAGDVIQLYMTWRDWPLTAQDYDLVLFNGSGTQVAISDKTQSGGQEPTEFLRFFVPTGGTYRVQVQAFSAPSPQDITLFSLFHDLEHAVASSSLVTPADVGSALSVAAIPWQDWGTGPQAPYSSQGPTTDGRPKPDITGPDNVQTFTMGAFEGTSAATPHVAGAAALLLSQNQGWNRTQLTSQLRSTAQAVGSPLATGSGRVRLSAPPTQRPDLQILNTDFSPRNPTVGDPMQYVVTVQNAGNAASGPFDVRLQDRNGATQRSVSGLSAGASVVLQFSRTLTATSDTITVTADPSDQVAESNEGNNTAQFTVAGQPQQQQRADLVVESMDFSPSDPAIGATLNWTVRVRNQGNAAAGTFRVELQSATGTRAATVGGLGAGASAQLGFSLGLSTDGQTFTATADAFDQVQETNEGNNQASRTVRASSPAPQGTIRTDQSNYTVGDRLQITFSTDQRAYAYIYNVDASGRVAQVFPNALSRSNPVNAGSYTLPDGSYSLNVTGPEGTESLHLLLSLRPVNVGLDGTRSSRYTDPATFESELTSRASGQLSGNEWSTTFSTFRVGAAAPSNQRPTASFSYSPTHPLPGQSVTFDASSSFDPDGTINQYRWDFQSDGFADASGIQVATSFPSSGSFSVTLTVVDDAGASHSTSQTVVVRSQPVNQPPTARFSFSPSNPQVGQTVIFDGTSSFDPDGTITEYRWDLNSDGRLDVTGARVSARFNSARNYSATLTVVDDQGASSSVTQTVRVGASTQQSASQASFSFSPSNPQVGQTVTFDGRGSSDADGSIGQYRWDFNNDGSTDATGAVVQFQFSSAGSFRVTLTVIDNGGLSNTSSRTVQVTSAPGPGPGSGGDPIPADRPGVYFLSESPDEVRVVVQGDPSWTSGHDYLVQISVAQGISMQSSSITKSGGATASKDINRSNLLRVTGKVDDDGRVEFSLTIRGFVQFILLTGQLDLDGDGEVERGTDVAQLVVEGKLITPASNPINVQSTSGAALPFELGETLTCPDSARSQRDCTVAE